MEYYKVYYWNGNNPDYWIGKAESKKDALKRSDKHISVVYDVLTLQEAIDRAESLYNFKTK